MFYGGEYFIHHRRGCWWPRIGKLLEIPNSHPDHIRGTHQHQTYLHEIVFWRITHKGSFQARSFLMASAIFHQLWIWSRDTTAVIRVSRDRTRGCRLRGGCACLCHGWGWGIWIGSGLLLGRLSGTTCYRGLQSWCSGSIHCVYYTPIRWPTVFESLFEGSFRFADVTGFTVVATRILLMAVWSLEWAATPVFLIRPEIGSVTPPT